GGGVAARAGGEVHPVGDVRGRDRQRAVVGRVAAIRRAGVAVVARGVGLAAVRDGGARLAGPAAARIGGRADVAVVPGCGVVGVLARVRAGVARVVGAEVAVVAVG